MPESIPIDAKTKITPISVLISAGIRCILHFFNGPNASSLDNTTNHLKGYIIEDFVIGESTVEQIEVPSENIIKIFASGMVTGGDITLKLGFDPDAGTPPLVKPNQGIVYTPQGVLWFGFLTVDKKGLVAYGELPVNISAFGEINLPKGQPGTSSMKFKITGEGAILGRENVGKLLKY